MVLFFLGLLFYAVLYLKGDPDPKLLPAFYAIYMEWLLIAGIALLLSSFSTPLLSIMLTLAAFLTGHLTESLLLLRSRIHSEAAGLILSALFYLLPNLELFNVRTQLVHNIPLSPLFFLETFVYGVLYLAALLLLAIRIFQKKDFV